MFLSFLANQQYTLLENTSLWLQSLILVIETRKFN